MLFVSPHLGVSEDAEPYLCVGKTSISIEPQAICSVHKNTERSRARWARRDGRHADPRTTSSWLLCLQQSEASFTPKMSGGTLVCRSRFTDQDLNTVKF